MKYVPGNLTTYLSVRHLDIITLIFQTAIFNKILKNTNQFILILIETYY